MALDLMTLGSSKAYSNLVALGLSDVSVKGTTVTFTLNNGEKASVTLPTPKDGKDGISITGVEQISEDKFVLLFSDGNISDPITTVRGKDGEPGKDGEKGESGVYTGTSEPSEECDVWINPDGEALEFKTINGESIIGKGNIEIQGGGDGGSGTIVVANPVLNGNEEIATSIQIGDEKYVFPQTNTNGLTSAQITMLESVLYSVVFTDASGKSKVDALIASLRSGVTPSEPDDDNPDTPTPDNPDDGDIYQYTDTITTDITSGKFNWGYGLKLNETNGQIEDDANYAISPKFFVPNGTNITINPALVNGANYMILYTTAGAFKERAVLASPYNNIRNNKGKDYYYQICSTSEHASSPTSFERGNN